MRSAAASLRGFVWPAFLAALGGCSLPPLAPWHPAPGGTLRSGGEVGVASWYGPGFDGQPTSSGEIYDQDALTAAHPTLPLGTRVLVTNLANGNALEVRVNDRGPFVDGRVIDLSYAAARALGLVGPGTAEVRVDRLAADDEAIGVVMYAVQIGAFLDGRRAAALRDGLAADADPVYVTPVRSLESFYYRVRVGPFVERVQALARARALHRAGVPALVVEEVAR